MPGIEDMIDKSQAEFGPVELPPEQQPEQAPARRFEIPEWVKAQTGPGDVEDYITHPLNFGKSRGVAQILRGLTGIVGELRYALLDIVMGAGHWAKERKVKVADAVASANQGH